jgi:calcium uptake protein 1, mitochondrial
VLALADVNKDGKIDFCEFVFFLTILQLPDIEILNVFRKKGSPEKFTMNKEAFSHEFTHLRKQTLIGRKQQNTKFIDARHISADEEDFEKANKSLIDVLFREKTDITADDFFKIKNDLIQELWHYEFHSFDLTEDGRISSEDFAKSLLSTLSLSSSMTYLKRIHKLSLEGSVSFDEYVAFNRLMRHSDIIKMKIATYRILTKEMLEELVRDFEHQDKFCKEKGVQISEVQMKTFFLMLDTDDSEVLEYEEIVGVLEGRKNVGQGKEQEMKNEMIEKFTTYVKKFKRLMGY